MTFSFVGLIFVKLASSLHYRTKTTSLFYWIIMRILSDICQMMFLWGGAGQMEMGDQAYACKHIWTVEGTRFGRRWRDGFHADDKVMAAEQNWIWRGGEGDTCVPCLGLQRSARGDRRWKADADRETWRTASFLYSQQQPVIADVPSRWTCIRPRTRARRGALAQTQNHTHAFTQARKHARKHPKMHMNNRHSPHWSQTQNSLCEPTHTICSVNAHISSFPSLGQR